MAASVGGPPPGGPEWPNAKLAFAGAVSVLSNNDNTPVQRLTPHLNSTETAVPLAMKAPSRRLLAEDLDRPP
jgi:hypothetical protein